MSFPLLKLCSSDKAQPKCHLLQFLVPPIRIHSSFTCVYKTCISLHTSPSTSSQGVLYASFCMITRSLKGGTVSTHSSTQSSPGTQRGCSRSQLNLRGSHGSLAWNSVLGWRTRTLVTSTTQPSSRALLGEQWPKGASTPSSS